MRRLAALPAPALAAIAPGCGGGQEEERTAPAPFSTSVPAPAPPPAPPERPTRFAVKGDWGEGGRAQAAVTRAMCRERRARPFRTVVTTGDNFSDGGTASRDSWDRPEACLIRAGVRWRPAWGNDDVLGDSTATLLGAPARSYTFVEGPARFVILDGNDPESPEQAPSCAGRWPPRASRR